MSIVTEINKNRRIRTINTPFVITLTNNYYLFVKHFDGELNFLQSNKIYGYTLI